MKQADLLKRIEELEARIRALEARPVYVPYAVPNQVPDATPYIGWPVSPGPTSAEPMPIRPRITC